MNIELIPAYDHLDIIRELFGEYTAMLADADPAVSRYLQLQNYTDELEHPEKKYGKPGGRLYIASADGQTAGCIALRRLDSERGELKRLYVRPLFRGKKIASALLSRIIDDARSSGCRVLLLDTLPALHSALHLYKKAGFYETEPYNNSPVETTIFMRLDL